RMPNGVINRRTLQHPYKQCRFFDFKAAYILVEVGFSCNLNAVRMIVEGNGIEIQRDNFFIGEVSFKLYGQYPFLCFADNKIRYRVNIGDSSTHFFTAGVKQIFGSLLSHCTASSLRICSHNAQCHADVRLKIHSCVIAEPMIFRHQERGYEVWWQLLISNLRTVVAVESPQRNAISRNQLRCQVVFGHLELCQIWHPSEPVIRLFYYEQDVKRNNGK